MIHKYYTIKFKIVLKILLKNLKNKLNKIGNIIYK